MQLEVSSRGSVQLLTILPVAHATMGRASEREVCLRIEPTSTVENRDKTLRISALHAELRYVGDELQLIDPGSTNGTKASRYGAIAKGVPIRLDDGDAIQIADVLSMAVRLVERRPIVQPSSEQLANARLPLATPSWLNEQFVGTERPGRYDFCQLRRLVNLPEQSYVLLFGRAEIGSTARALIGVSSASPRPSVGRGLDLIVDSVPDTLGVLCWVSEGLTVTAQFEGALSIDGQSLSKGFVAQLRGGQNLTANDTTIRVI